MKVITDISSLDSDNILPTSEVIKTANSYWFIQDYDSASTKTLADFLASANSNQIELTYEQMQKMARQLVGTMSGLYVQSKFVHGYLD